MKGSESGLDTGILSNPLSFLRSERFDSRDASLGLRGMYGYFWSLRSSNNIDANFLSFDRATLYPRDYGIRSFGIAVRCVARFSKSFTTLINTSYSMNKADSDSRDSGLLSNPLSFLRSGYFYGKYAGLYYRGGVGGYWSLPSYSAGVSYSLYFGGTNLSLQDRSNRDAGFAVRCVRQILHHSH